jgi:hypothetical protein
MMNCRGCGRNRHGLFKVQYVLQGLKKTITFWLAELQAQIQEETELAL